MLQVGARVRREREREGQRRRKKNEVPVVGAVQQDITRERLTLFLCSY